MKAVLIGYGEVGKGLYEVLSEHHDIAIHDPALEHLAYDDFLRPNVLLISIPYGNKFVDVVKGYQNYYEPKATIIFSSVPIGTSRKCNAIHSPIEGRHDNMAESIRRFPRWFSGTDKTGLVMEFFQMANLSVCHVAKQETTEFMKLQSLAVYGIGIEWARYCKKMTDQIGFDYNLLKIYNQDYNNLVQEVHKNPDLIRYNLDPPGEGKRVGGHCVLVGMGRLQEEFGHPFIQTVLDFNKEDK